MDLFDRLDIDDIQAIAGGGEQYKVRELIQLSWQTSGEFMQPLRRGHIEYWQERPLPLQLGLQIVARFRHIPSTQFNAQARRGRAIAR